MTTMASLVSLFVVILPVLIRNVASWKDHPICGKYHRPPPGWNWNRIFEGKKTYVGEHPWVIGLNSVDDQPVALCNGAILTSKWFVTAAHCVDGNKADLMFNVWFGRNDLRDISTGGYIRFQNIWDVTTFRWGGRGDQNFDIAFVKLPGPDYFPLPETTSDLSKLHTNRLCLNAYPEFKYEEEFESTKVYMASFGLQAKNLTTNEDHEDSRKVLSQMEGFVVDPRVNYKLQDRYVYKDLGRFIWHNIVTQQHSCPGDSGSPVIILQNPLPIVDIAGISRLRASLVGVHEGSSISGSDCAAQPERRGMGLINHPLIAGRFDVKMRTFIENLINWDRRSFRNVWGLDALRGSNLAPTQ